MSINVDPDSLDNKKLAAIAKNPKHPLHTHAKSIIDRRRSAQKEHAEHMGEGAMKRMATNETEPKPEKKKGMETYKKMKKKMDEAMLTRKQISRAAAIGASKAKPKDQVTLKKAPWEKDKKEVKEYGGPPISRAKYLKQKPMGEKTLTSNEKKKREEIAQAIKRDNPDMPMAKKMAIATATAKKVAEEVKYPHPMYDPKTGKKVMAKSPADHNKYDKMGYTHDKPDINEISVDKLARYGSAAAKDVQRQRNKVKGALDQPLSTKHQKAGMDAMKKLTKRSKGSDMYVDKMTGRSKVKPSLATVGKDKKESVNEVSKEKLFNYMRKSAADVSKASGDARRQDKRIGGQKKADDKIRAMQGKRDASHIKVPATEGKARDRLMAIVNKASGRTDADRQADAKKATERRKEADKDLADFRKKSGMS